MEDVVGNRNPKKKRIGKILLIGLVAVVVVSMPAHFIWKKSGSGEWKLYSDKKGVKCYTMKTPGSVYLKFKSIGTLQSTMSSVIKLMRDPNAAEDVGCYDAHMIDSVSPELMYYTFKQNYFWPLKPREFVVKSDFIQNPETKAIVVTFNAAPDKIPPTKNCYRIVKMNNEWRYTPVGNGQIKYEFTYNSVDPGGNFPYFLTNLMVKVFFPEGFYQMPKILAKEKYKDARVDYVKEAE